MGNHKFKKYTAKLGGGGSSEIQIWAFWAAGTIFFSTKNEANGERRADQQQRWGSDNPH